MRSLWISAAMGVVVAGITLLCSPLVGIFAGSSFRGAIQVLQWLCWLPLLRGIHRMSGTVLTGSGNQHLRTGAQFIVAIFNIVLNIFWIPAYGWKGAAWSSLASDGLLGVLNLALLAWVSKGRGGDRMMPEAAMNIESEAAFD
jgi:O-antigen/teichoic acid export membrane protein